MIYLKNRKYLLFYKWKKVRWLIFMNRSFMDRYFNAKINKISNNLIKFKKNI